MNVSNCKSCGRLFNVITSSRICPDCQRKTEEKFQEVKRYLDQNPNASIDSVATDNSVSVKQIKQWVKEERLTFAEGSMDGVECEQCGKLIRTGRYCEMCKINLANTLQSALNQPARIERTKKVEHERDRMRFLQK